MKKNFKIKRQTVSAVLLTVHLFMAGCGATLQSVEKDKELGLETAKAAALLGWQAVMTKNRAPPQS